jgi:hypothetical protein
MKYLKLYEAFDSTILSSLFRYVKSNIPEGYNRFKYNFNKFCNLNDIEFSKINDDNIKYLKSSKAIEYGLDKEYDSRISLIKYWFSLSDGYICSTIVGRHNEPYGDKFPDFSVEQIHKLKEDGVKGSITRYSFGELSHMDKVIISWSPSEITTGMVVRYSNTLYVLHNMRGKSGNIPGNMANYNDYRFGWELLSPDRFRDYGSIHKYTESDEDLHYVNDNKESYLSKNLFYDLEHDSISNWEFNFNYIEKIEKSDFCIILDISKINKNLDTKKKYREESRKDALGLKTNNEIREMNFDRYFDTILKSIINIETNVVKDLQQIIIRSYLSEYVLPCLLTDNYLFDEDIISSISKSMKMIGLSKDDMNVYSRNYEDESKTYMKGALRKLDELHTDYKRVYFRLDKNELLSFIRKEELFELEKLVIRIFKISDKIYKFLLRNKINNIMDYRFVQTKLRSIKQFMNYREYKLQSNIYSMFNSFLGRRDFTKYALSVDSLTLSEDNEIIDYLDKYIDSIFNLS